MLQVLISILISAFVGVLIGVLFEEPLNQLKEAAISYCKHIFYRPPDISKRAETFSFANIATSWLVIDGDGKSTYTHETIRSHFEPHADSLPEELLERKNQIQKQEEENLQRGLPFKWNGGTYSLDRFVISRDKEEEYLVLELFFKPSDYYTFLATNMSLDEEPLRAKYLREVDWLKPVKYFSNSFGINLAVITSDQQIIISQRSIFVGSRPSEYNISANEAISRSLDRGVDGYAPDNYRCASRGLVEELGLSEPKEFSSSDIIFLSFGVDTRYAQWGLLGMVKVDKTAVEILEWRTTGVKDKWENNKIHFVKFDLDFIVPFVLSHSPWAPGGLACLYHTLVHEFGRHKVDRAIKKHSPRVSQSKKLSN
jgi:hypothetical protein